jgi:two-component SAPR family response regulator
LFNKLAEKTGASVGITALFQEIRDFENTLPTIHKVVRRYSSTIDFGNPKLTIRAFGRSQIKIRGKTITSGDLKTQTARDLFFFILAHPEGVTKEEIGEAFWLDADEDTIKLRFKNSIYRLRRAIGTETITYVDNFYRFNRALDYDYDVDTFQAELDLARNSNESAEMMDHYRAALSNYHGKFLPKIDQEWIIGEREKHHLAFMAAYHDRVNLYMLAGKYAQALAVANRALEEDNYNEVFHRSAMAAYSALDDRPAVVRQFEKCKRILKKELDIDPSPQTISLYNSLVQ